ncbi:cytosolic sulfotransferase 15-like [Henckelia pumila]|uniref:cytosolic sulfotransferase 15-like n=1 Tax=Henckelia pumila TaxID=405737 RepID=UPI003C6E1EDD
MENINESSVPARVDAEDSSTDDLQGQELLQGLEKASWHGVSLCKYKGVWCPLTVFVPTLRCEKYFKARDTDIILATLPKAGTTWLKALTFAVVNRSRYPLDKHPLLTSNPQSLIPSLEFNIYDQENENPDLDLIPDPRIFSTHTHYDSLVSTVVVESKCRVIHICRNPLDQVISLWHFMINMIGIGRFVPLDEFLETYCQGMHVYGPFWEHVLGYWNAHLKSPEKVLFLKYEDLKKDINFSMKKIAEFIGFPFSLEEEKAGLIEEIAKLCSFDKLKNLEVNKVGMHSPHIKNSYFFRKGEIGDSANYLTPHMVDRIEKVVEEKFEGSGLKF